MVSARKLIQNFANILGYSIHRKDTIDRLVEGVRRFQRVATDARWNTDQALSYSGWMEEVTGARVLAPAVILATSFSPETPWGARFYDAMCRVEHEWVEELLKSIHSENVPGAIVEFGILEGYWVGKLYDTTEAIGMTDRMIIGFDSFRGLSSPHPVFDDPFWKEGTYKATRELVDQRLRTVERPRIKLVEGYFADSLMTEAATQINQIAFARIDCDIYEPALQCLNYLGSRLTDGAILVFDDWPHQLSVGEGRAFYEWVPAVPHLRFEFLGYGAWGHLYLRVWYRDQKDATP